MASCSSRKNSKEWQYFKLKMSSEDHASQDEKPIDTMTWRQWINNALKRSHGIFGEGIDYSFLNQDDHRAYVRVRHHDRNIFSSAVSTYISTNELTGTPLIVIIEQETSNLTSLNTTEDDELWLRRAKESESEDSRCA